MYIFIFMLLSLWCGSYYTLRIIITFHSPCHTNPGTPRCCCFYPATTPEPHPAYRAAAIRAAIPARATGAATAPAAEEPVLLVALLEAVPVLDDEPDSVDVAVDVAVDLADAVPDDVPEVVPDVVAVPDPVADVLSVPVVAALPVSVVVAPDAVSAEEAVALTLVGPQADSNEDWRDTSAAVALLSRLAYCAFRAVPVSVALASMEYSCCWTLTTADWKAAYAVEYPLSVV